VVDFYAILDLLTELSGLDLDNFRLPSSEYLQGEAQTAADRYCERSLLTQKIDACSIVSRCSSLRP
jgi:hypothetical protein